MIQAIFKIAGKEHDYWNEDAVEKTVNYILRDSARRKDDLWGSMGTVNKSREGIIEDLYKLKRLYDKKDKLQLKHLILSWGKRPNLPRKKMRKLIKRTLGFWSRDYQVVYAVHEDKLQNEDHSYHMHMVLNSVSNTGRKIQITGKVQYKFRKHFNRIWNPYGYEMKM